MTEPILPLLLTVKQPAGLLGIGRTTVYEVLDAGEFHADDCTVRVGNGICPEKDDAPCPNRNDKHRPSGEDDDALGTYRRTVFATIKPRARTRPARSYHTQSNQFATESQPTLFAVPPPSTYTRPAEHHG